LSSNRESNSDEAAGSAFPSRGRPTMRDVAALAGVSLKTVSRVINGESTVDAGLAARVRRAADALDYAAYVVDQAQLAVLDAVDARTWADARAAAHAAGS